MTKNEVLKIIDEVMNNREIDSIRNAILAIRDKVNDYPEYSKVSKEVTDLGEHYAKLKLRGHNNLHCTSPFFPEAKYVCIDTAEKIDTGLYGAYWFE